MNRLKRFISLLIWIGFSQIAWAQGVGRQLLPGHLPAAIATAPWVEAMDPQERLDLAIGLPLRNTEGLRDFLHRLYDPQDPLYRHFLTPDEFAARYGPAPSDYQALIRFVTSNGLIVTHLYSNRALLSVTGKVADIQMVFHVNLSRHRRPDGTLFYAPDREPSVDLDVPLGHIGGLENYDRFVSHQQKIPLPPPAPYLKEPGLSPRPTPASTGSGINGWYQGFDFRDAYIPGISLEGAGQTIAIIANSGFRATDISGYETMAGLPSNVPSRVLCGGFGGALDGGANESEAELDIEMAICMAPQAYISVYEGSNNDAIFAAIAAAPAASFPRQINFSFTTASTVVDTNVTNSLAQFAAQGQSFFESAGDSGAYTTGLSQFLNENYVTSVGGTVLVTNGVSGPWAGEGPWFWSSGGISNLTPIPTYQAGVLMDPIASGGNGGSTAWRNVPDVSMVATDLITEELTTTLYGASGTSAAAPLWAGFMALVNQQAALNARPPVGFANPALYTIGQNQNYLFHDVVGGGTNSVYPAVPGYDLVTGWGSPTACLVNVLAGLPACATPTATPPPTSVGTGTGLCAQYFTNDNLMGSPCAVGPVSQIQWAIPSGGGLTVTGCGVLSTKFSIEYTGFVQPPNTGVYTFYTLTDDGCRLIVTDIATSTPYTIVNHWADQSDTFWPGTTPFTMQAGALYPIEMDYYQDTAAAEAALYWAGPGITFQGVSSLQLYPGVCAMPTATPTGTWYTSTPTSTPTLTATNSPTLTPTHTATLSPTATLTWTATSTPTGTPTSSMTATPTPTASWTATFTATETATNSTTLTPTWTPTSTSTLTPTITDTSSPTATFTPTPSPSDSPTRTETPTPSWSPTPQPTGTPTASATPSPSATVSTVSIGPPYPNPVQGPSPVSLQIQLPAGSTVEWSVFTTAFRKILDVSNGVSGNSTVLVWDMEDAWKKPVASGLYYLRVQVTGPVKASKILKVLVIR